MERVKKIKMPYRGGRRPTKNFRAKPEPSKKGVTLRAMDTGEHFPTLVFKKKGNTWVVPPLKVPLYWFDKLMFDRKLIIPVNDNVFIVDGRRFRAIAQDYKIIGVGYTRWLVYEEAAVPKGGTL